MSRSSLPGLRVPDLPPVAPEPAAVTTAGPAMGRRARPTPSARLGHALVGVMVSAAFVWLLARGVDWRRVRADFETADRGAVLAAAGVMLLTMVYKALRWRYQLEPIRRVARGAVLSATAAGFLGNNVLPVRGGDLLRARLLARSEGLATAAVLSTVALERVFDLASLLLLTAGLLAVLPLPHWLVAAAAATVLVLAAAVAAIGVLRRPPPRLVGWWEASLPYLTQRGRAVARAVASQARQGITTLGSPSRVLAQLVLALLEWVLWGIAAHFTLVALGDALPPVAVAEVVIAANFAAAVPAAPAGIGVFEFAVASVLAAYGLDQSLAVSGAIAVHAVFVLPGSLLGLVFVARDAYLLAGPNE